LGSKGERDEVVTPVYTHWSDMMHSPDGH
jgi:hypothetical protein